MDIFTFTCTDILDDFICLLKFELVISTELLLQHTLDHAYEKRMVHRSMQIMLTCQIVQF